MSIARTQGGFTYVMMVAALAILGVGLAAAGQAWSEHQRRVREQELLRVGAAFIRAIESYYESSPGTQKVLPARLEDLLQDNRFAGTRRHLRRVYADPVTGRAEWGLVRSPMGGISGVHSLSDRSAVAAGTQMVANQPLRFSGRYSDVHFVYVPLVAKEKKK
jgi:type II secretory pathway pseudopilin PulG